MVSKSVGIVNSYQYNGVIYNLLRCNNFPANHRSMAGWTIPDRQPEVMRLCGTQQKKYQMLLLPTSPMVTAKLACRRCDSHIGPRRDPSRFGSSNQSRGMLAMTVHRIRLLGDPILRARCEPITKPRSTAVRVILDDMRETLRDWQSRFGSGRAIAAPQIGAPVRMIYCEMDQPWALINPEIIDIGHEDFEVWDDCFSFPNLLVRVSRAYRVRVRYQDTKGEWHEVELEADRAELLQHEIDHLDGVLAVDRPQGLDPFCLREEWHRLHGPGARYGPPEDRNSSYATPLTGLI